MRCVFLIPTDKNAPIGRARGRRSASRYNETQQISTPPHCSNAVPGRVVCDTARRSLQCVAQVSRRMVRSVQSAQKIRKNVLFIIMK
jgi:hypothetical protein